jgi:hypothetical protein
MRRSLPEYFVTSDTLASIRAQHGGAAPPRSAWDGVSGSLRIVCGGKGERGRGCRKSLVGV